MFYPGDWVFLDATNIKTICLSPKLLHYCLRLFVVECQVESLAHCLKLPHMMKKLHLVFIIVKLFTAPEDLILRRKPKPPP